MAEVLITSEFFGKYSGEGKRLLLEKGHTVSDNPFGHSFMSQEQIIRHIGGAEAVICDLERYDKTVIDSAPALKIISRRGVGVDSVDTEYASQRGIAVARTPGVVEAPVAELCMGYILELSRGISAHSRAMHCGVWEKRQSMSVAGKTLGIFGMGKIAMALAARAHAFGMNIIYVNPFANEACEENFGGQRVSLNDLLQNSDFISLHAPLTDETKGLFDREIIGKMKPGAFLINTARGPIVDETALLEALQSGHLAGAAVDVYDVEPKTDSVLREAENCILTPHIGTFTTEVFIEMDILAAKNIISFFENNK